ncbi:MAG: tetratricopeptide repeat protein [Melioribacteraceae bacterium]|nr:tetratricopeptide repeat protein [Melioribacteraceae bacterium]
MKNYFTKNFSFSFIIIFLLLIELIITRLPLFNSINYEFSVVNGFILYFLGGYLVYSSYKEKLFYSFFSFLIEEKLKLILLFFIPLIFGLLSTILFSKCPISNGIEFYFSITFFSFSFGIFLSFIFSKLFSRFSFLVFIIISVFLLFLSFLEFYLYPQIYSYNPIYGFINGTIYDEDVSVNKSILFFHLFNVIIFITINYLINIFIIKNISKIYSFVFILFFLLISFIIKPYFGFATNNLVLEQSLSSKIKTEHFEIYVDQNFSIDEKKLIALLHEYYYEQVCLKLNEDYENIITSYIFKNSIQKRLLFGSQNADVAKPWLNEIYITKNSIYETLKHEIAHVVASNFGTSIFKVAKNINPALIEGLAMFTENDFDGYEIDFVANLFLNYNKNYKVENLFHNGNFFSSYSSIAYVISGSFLNFVNNRYGIQKVKELYRTNDIEKLTNKSFSELELEYKLYLERFNYSYNKYKAQLYFGGKSITQKFCPRDAAVQLKIANKLFNDKNYLDAIKHYQKIYNYSKSFNSLNGIVKCKILLKDYNSALRFLEREIKVFKNDQYLFNIELLLSECYLLNGQLNKADSLLNELIIQNPGYNYVTEAKFRKELIKNLNEKAGYYNFQTEKERFKTLKNIFNQNKNNEITLRLINLSNKLNMDDSEFIYHFESNKDSTDFYSTLLLSKYYLNKNNFLKAKLFAIEAVKKNVPVEEKFRAIENLRLINWIVNYQNEEKITIE